MAKELFLELILLEAIVIFVFLTIVLLVAKTKNTIDLEKKFSKYTVIPKNYSKLTFFDKIYRSFNRLIKKVSTKLCKINFINIYAEKYNKYISYEYMKLIKGVDYVSLKIVLSILFFIIYIILDLISLRRITVIGTILAILIGFFIIDVYLIIKDRMRRKMIEDDLLKAVVIMNNSFESGKSIVQAIETVEKELDGPISDEFKKIHMDMNYGLNLDLAFDRFYDRVRVKEVKYITSSLTLLNKTGGNIVKVFTSIEKEIFNKKKLNDELKAMTSSSMYIFRLLLVLPFIIYSLIFVLNKEYFQPLFSTTIGLLILSFIIILYVLYIIIVNKIMKVDV